MKRVVGITGGISSGKSNVCSVIKELGYPIIDCDKITKDLSQIDGPIYNAILKHFGPDYFLDNEELDRKKLGKLIFNNIESKVLLDKISHPLVKIELLNQLESYKDGLVFIEVPLLYESGLDELCDNVICVFLPKELQIERLMARDNINYEYAIAKIDSQMDLYKKKILADFVIDSRGSFDETKSQVVKIINNIKGV